jgi:hypothetical protein
LFTLDPQDAVSNFLVRFVFTSDYSIVYSGWYVDDVGIRWAGLPLCEP